MNSTQIPEVLVPMAYARLADLTAQELEVRCGVRLTSLDFLINLCLISAFFNFPVDW